LNVKTQRAYGEADKQARRRTILAAAETLFRPGQPLPSAADIAAASDLAKGTVYIYYRSREDIFATLLESWWADIIVILEGKVTSAAPASQVPSAFIENLASLIEGKPKLMPLDAMLSVLRAGMSPEVSKWYHDTTSAQIERLGGVLDQALRVSPGRGVQLLIRSHAFARGLWQGLGYMDPSYKIASALRPNFSEELMEALEQYWRGALAAPL
jgi:AcrR family transcriptional regulator